MRFLYPLFLAGAAAVAIPIVLHLLRRDVAPEVPFSAVRLLRRTPLERTRRRTLRELLLLAARVAALVLLAAAFARPYLLSATDEPLLVVALDRSYSMGAPGRLERALALVRDAFEVQAAGSSVAAIAFDDRADVLAPPGAAALAKAALENVRPGYGGTRYAPVIEKAIELGDGGPVRLVIVTDLQRAGWAEQEPIAGVEGLDIDWVDAGASANNISIASVRHEPEAVKASIRNHGSQASTGTARVVRDGRTVASAPYSVPASGSVEVSIPYRAPASGALAVEIDDRDGYPADNRRYVILDPQDRAPVLIVSDEGSESGYFLVRALQAPVGDEAFDVRSVPGTALGRMAPQELSRVHAIVLLTTKGLDRRAREVLVGFVRSGGGLLAVAGEHVEAAVLAAAMGWSGFSAVEQQANGRRLAATDLRHPIFRPFGPIAANLAQVRFTSFWRVRGDGWSVAGRFSDGSPALLERVQGRGRVVLFASDVDRRWNDFPLHPGFVPFALESVRHIARDGEARRDYVVADAPAGTHGEPGVYVIDEGRRRVSVNVDPREGTVERISPEELAAMVNTKPSDAATAREVRARQVESRQNLWRYGLMLVLGALVVESLLGRSRA